MSNILYSDLEMDIMRSPVGGNIKQVGGRISRSLPPVLHLMDSISITADNPNQNVIENPQKDIQVCDSPHTRSIRCTCYTYRNRNKNLDHIIEGYRSMYKKVEVFHIPHVYNTHNQMRNTIDTNPLPTRCIALKEKEDSIVCVALWE